jgi:hypothetical protein
MKLTDALADAILAELDEGKREDIIANEYEVTVITVREVCGLRGHEWETVDNGDGIWMQSYTVCVLCGAPGEPYEEEP